MLPTLLISDSDKPLPRRPTRSPTIGRLTYGPTRGCGRYSSIIKEGSDILDRLGCSSFLSALASISRMCSRVNRNCWHADPEVHAQNALFARCDRTPGEGCGGARA